MDKNERILGIATYQINDWKKLLQISEDRDTLEPSWEEWNDNLHQYEELLRKEHKSFIEILLNLDELISFCNKRGLLINGESRSIYVTEKLHELYLK